MKLMAPRYPEIHVQLCSSHPFAMVSAVRQAMRRHGLARQEIRRFTEEALQGDTPEVCASWAVVEVDGHGRPFIPPSTQRA